MPLARLLTTLFPEYAKGASEPAVNGLEVLPGSVAREICNKCASANFLLGTTPSAKAQVSQVMSLVYIGAADPPALAEQLDGALVGRSFLAGEAFSLADLAALLATHKLVTSGSPHDKLPNFTRWFDQAQHSARWALARTGADADRVHQDLPALVPLPLQQTAPIVAFVPRAAASAGGPPAPLSPKKAAQKPKPAAAAAANEGKKAKKDQKEGTGGALEAKGSEAPKTDKKEKKGKKEKAEAKGGGGGGAGAGAAGLNPALLDIRVGKIVEVWEHPEAEKLFCEKIDVGEAEPRQIASGLRHHYKLSEMQNKDVLVLCNLKGRNLVGFKSTGMVLCASSQDKGTVKLVQPPAGAKIGDRVTFPGYEGTEPATPAQVGKKKILECLAPHLVTDVEGTAMFRDPADKALPFTVEGSGVCEAPVPNGTVS
mmetsp:Transcript_12033/g.17738  ORF Transcript_12033/g.17738 Transcript_12033/m.17738 type:complete len:427 (-) Transcript_12033:160-1440(-)|eukprot:CAMPEP_0113939404 /NCGR_PEP_ID=MMETSP1339-20121228/5730_1 /TAXON_ID=94617 /ORGANISM="Fibrocapsa japonica" /LENGTH=426 /DNA_ID=CAMNT_0000942903 /DNA_START=31 /DNA_END=1311 /DNA_ORIENTATION=- /assembly_acc=CAM_ASM_000762